MSSVLDFSNQKNYHVAALASAFCICIGLLLGYFIFKCKQGFDTTKDDTNSGSVGLPVIANATSIARYAPGGATMVFQIRVPHSQNFWDPPTRNLFLQSVDNYNKKVERMIKAIPSDKRITVSRDKNPPVELIGINVLFDKDVAKDTCTYSVYKANTSSKWIPTSTPVASKPKDAIAFVEKLNGRIDNMIGNLQAVQAVLANYPPA